MLVVAMCLRYLLPRLELRMVVPLVARLEMKNLCVFYASNQLNKSPSFISNCIQVSVIN
jgi:hypothetical protein